MQVLSCKQGCVTELASEPSREKPLEDFLPSHFNYLQFAYYNSKQLGASSPGDHRCWTLCSARTEIRDSQNGLGWDLQSSSNPSQGAGTGKVH